MSKKAEAMSTSDVAEPANPVAAAVSELAAAEEAIQDATAFAEASHQSGDVGADAGRIERTELTATERAALARKIASRQRSLGMAELEKQYPSALVVNVALTLNDPNIASSATRFLGLADRVQYLVNRFGFRFMSEAEIEAIRVSIREQIEVYAQEAAQAMEQGKMLIAEARAKAQERGDDWLSPEYSSSSLQTEFAVKARETMQLVKASRSWDEAILMFASLEFNAGADIGQIDTLRHRERRLFMNIHRICVRTINAFYKRQKDKAKPRGGDASKAAIEEPVAA